MGDSTQEQLNKMFELLLSEQKANQNRSEQMDQFQAQLDAISRDLQSTKLSLSSSSTESQHRPRKEKGTMGATNSESSGEHLVVPKYTKLDFPRYNGLEDPLGWLSRCQLFFKHQSTLEEEKVGLASIHLEGIAQLWYLQLIQDNPEPTWTDFESQCNKRFGPPIRSNKLGELAKLKQTGSVEDYQNKFETLVSRAGTLTQLQKIQLYISGLQEYIAVEVELHQPQDLVSAMSMSRLYERKLNSRLPSNRDFRRPSNPPEPRTARPIKRLTPDEMDDRRKKGLCFNCDEPFVRGHQCKRLFLIDLAEELQSDEDMDLDPSPEISLHAITGTQTSQSMRLRGVWNGLQVLILVDSGSTHSFISLAKLSENGVNVDAKAGFRVKVANGEQLHSPGIGAVLLQNNKPVAFFSRAMAVRHISLPAYEKELIGLVKAIRHWQSYLWGKQFVVRTDHYTLKFLLEQRSLSSPQQHWVSKLLPFDFKVEYKPGKANTVADALSRRDVDQHSLYAISLPQLDLFDDIRREQQSSSDIQQLITTVLAGTAADVWSFKQGLLFFKNRVYIPPESPSVTLVMTALHNQGHEGYQKTLHRITRDFYWRGMKHMIQDFVRACEVCQPATILPPLDNPAPQAPLTVLGQRIRAGIHEVLIHWKNTNPTDSSWERVSDINNRFPEFKLEDKLSVGVGSIVNRPLRSYTRRKPRVNIQEIED
ncbi:hypothetical protein GH714_019917 [Hevea brasiliensis]|uniref:Reverse transcriptase RNase H-like domain-containing protein n=2 Tax=Hevea brasiliensis TaxID=3981 RepID=A0A6A6KLG8_HEVBR|nr:hypothetical protein GH714_019917 [Hevea brasiliensis]